MVEAREMSQEPSVRTSPEAPQSSLPGPRSALYVVHPPELAGQVHRRPRLDHPSRGLAGTSRGGKVIEIRFSITRLTGPEWWVLAGAPLFAGLLLLLVAAACLLSPEHTLSAAISAK